MGRSATDAEKENGNAILKDLDINRVILIGSDMKKKLVEQLDKDTKVINFFLVGKFKKNSRKN